MNAEKLSDYDFSSKNSRPLNVAGILCTPVVLAGGLLLCLSYIADIIITGRIETSIGETSVLSGILFDTAGLINKLIYPVIGAGIAVSLSGYKGLYAGLLGGMLANTGANLITTNANVTGISGLFGTIAAGYMAGYSQKAADKLISRGNIATEYKAFLSPIVSLIITGLGILAINTVSFYINHFASVLLGVTAKSNGLPVSLLLGLFLSADSGGPLYLTGYTFGVASITTGWSQYMAAVIAGGAIPSVCVGFYTLIHSEKVNKGNKLTGIICLIGGLVGIPQFSVSFYLQKNYRFILSCIPGGMIASTLSFALGCSCEIPAGGILAFSFSNKPPFFLLALICGGLVSTFILNLLDKPNEQTDKEEKISSHNTSLQT